MSIKTAISPPSLANFGKFIDRNPEIVPAGILTASVDENVKSLSRHRKYDCQSPEPVRRLRDYISPDVSNIRVHFGQAKDLERKWAKNMTHGVVRQSSGTAKNVVNPPLLTSFQEAMNEYQEKHYKTNKVAPLGKSAETHGGLPDGLSKEGTMFGIKTFKDAYAGECLNPPKNWLQISREALNSHDMYNFTHKSYFAGEQASRNYKCPPFDSTHKYGKPTPHHNDGRNTEKAVKQNTGDAGSKVVSDRLENFRERYQSQLGKVLDPISDTMRVSEDHTYGLLLRPDDFGAGDLLHNRNAGDFLRRKDQIRGMVAAVRNQLKKENWTHFDTLKDAFAQLDKTKSGSLGIEDFRKMLIQFGLPLDDRLVKALMDYTAEPGTSLISYHHFVELLNWQGRFPDGLPPMPAFMERQHKKGDSKITKQIDPPFTAWSTSSSIINARVGVGGINTRNYRRYGVPTIRHDLSAPNVKRVSDRKNYGDESDAHTLLNPNVYSRFNVFEKDMFKPRSQFEIRDIMDAVGMKVEDFEFSEAFRRASSGDSIGLVSLESFRASLDELLSEN